MESAATPGTHKTVEQALSVRPAEGGGQIAEPEGTEAEWRPVSEVRSATAAAPPASNRRRRWLMGGAALAVAAPALWYLGSQPIARPGAGGSAGGAARGVGPQVDFEAPNFSLKDPTGKTIELKQLRGKPVLLNFWATWCAPCREEMPELELLYREHKDKGLVVLAVSMDEARAARDIPEFLKEGDPRVGAYTFPVALDLNQEVVKQYKLLGVPQSYFIDPAGVIRVVQPRVMSRDMMLEGLKTIMPSAAGTTAGTTAGTGAGAGAATGSR
jgi:peroxiredoxin